MKVLKRFWPGRGQWRTVMMCEGWNGLSPCLAENHAQDAATSWPLPHPSQHQEKCDGWPESPKTRRSSHEVSMQVWDLGHGNTFWAAFDNLWRTDFQLMEVKAGIPGVYAHS